MGLFKDRGSKFKVAESKPPTKSLLKPAVCLFCLFVFFFSKAFNILHSFGPLGWSRSSMRDKRKRRLQKKLTNQNRALKLIFLNTS